MYYFLSGQGYFVHWRARFVGHQKSRALPVVIVVIVRYQLVGNETPLMANSLDPESFCFLQTTSLPVLGAFGLLKTSRIALCF